MDAERDREARRLSGGGAWGAPGTLRTGEVDVRGVNDIGRRGWESIERGRTVVRCGLALGPCAGDILSDRNSERERNIVVRVRFACRRGGLGSGPDEGSGTDTCYLTVDPDTVRNVPSVAVDVLGEEAFVDTGAEDPDTDTGRGEEVEA